MIFSFWFEFGSTYSYPAALRLPELATGVGVAVHWRPFLLGPIFSAQGWNDSPFNLYSSKGRYMWRDLERICADHGLPWRRPSVFPRSGLTAARIACAARDEPWLSAFIAAVYEANFADDRDIAAADVLRDCLSQCGQAADPWLARAGEPTVKDGLRANTEQALALGIFGAPTCAVGTELFWGHDRMEQALAWAVHHGATARSGA